MDKATGKPNSRKCCHFVLMNENEVGAKHLVMIITNEVFCNKYGYDRQGKKRNFLRYRRNIYARAFPTSRYSYTKTAVRALFIELFGTDGVGLADGVHR